MQTRPLGRTGITVSAISLGTEHILDEVAGLRDLVISAAIDRGITYFDTFYAHPGFRDGLGAILQGRRQQVHLAAHLGAACQPDGQYYRTHNAQEAEPFFHDYLKRVRTDYVDVLMLHNVNSVEELQGLFAYGGLLEMAQRFQQQGKVRCIGLSGHSALANIVAVESGKIDVLMAPVNLACQGVPGFKELLSACAVHQVGLVAMKPYGGGSLLRQVGQVAVESWALGRMDTNGGPNRFTYTDKITPLQCLEYVMRLPEVSCTVPGCKTLAELDAALAYLTAKPAERDISSLLPAFAEVPPGQCVYCNHCLPCPVGIDISKVNDLLDRAQGGLTDLLRQDYAALLHPASECLECGECEPRCPFDVAVTTRLQQAAALYEG